LTPEQQRIWRDKLAALPSGFIPREQAETFEAWCVCRDEWLRAADIIAKSGLLVEGRDGNQVKNPAVMVQVRMQDELRRLEAALRLNDADLIRRHIPEPTPIWIRQPKESA
jgi:P27 family predicted phage terminase small subunit